MTGTAKGFPRKVRRIYQGHYHGSNKATKKNINKDAA
jgi:hypothetical protein